MFVIAGLGNPTEKYAKTRHNAGFDTIDILAEKLNVKMKKTVFNAMVGKTVIGGEKTLLVKPLTFMNLSGNAVRSVCRFYKIDPKEKLVVIYDDSDLEEGRLRLRKKGSAGSHNGMKSIVSCLGTEEFFRIRVGIGNRPEQMDMVDYVLGRYDKETRKIMEDAFAKAADAAVDIVEHGMDHAMNQFN
ncbi:MAG: aminoacyl-tRNA hydrolase [Lachnospiraceae bacterium]|nr:aminoacyl-tRNA hydrolase [Lachnospiraceae bacterium]